MNTHCFSSPFCPSSIPRRAAVLLVALALGSLASCGRKHDTTAGADSGSGEIHDAANLGVCYAKGEGVAEDYVEAYKWMSLASAQGHEAAEKALPVIEGKMTKTQVKDAQRLARTFKPSKPPEPGVSPLGQPPSQSDQP